MEEIQSGNKTLSFNIESGTVTNKISEGSLMCGLFKGLKQSFGEQRLESVA